MMQSCGCGGAATEVTTAFVRPRFFAGMLLTEDDLRALTGYMTGKDRLHNRRLEGSGVVCGLEVTCDPCGGGSVNVRPGYALDCCGNDLVVGCPEKVDVATLVNDLRVRSLGTDCGDACGDNGENGTRTYGLYLRYTEERIEPITPYPTAETCAPAGCEPSRIRETYKFVVKCPEEATDHRYRPDQWLTARLGDEERLADVRARGWRLGAYGDAALRAVWSGSRPIQFDQDAAARFKDAVAVLDDVTGQPTDAQVPALVEQIRALAGGLARLDTYPADERDRVAGEAGVDIAAGRRVLGTAVAAVRPAVERAFPDSLRQQIAVATLDEAQGRADESEIGLETRLLAQGLPLTYALRVALIADAHRVRQWLLTKLESGDAVDCGLLRAVESLTMPRQLPAEPVGDNATVSAADLAVLGRAAATLGSAVVRHVTDTACAAVRPPCGDCDDTDVLIAEVEMTDCEVLRICAAGREHVLPGGPGYAAWSSVLTEARELAERLCCGPAPACPEPDRADAGDGPVRLGYLAKLLSGPPAAEDLDRLLRLLRPEAAHTELDALRERVAELSRQVEALVTAAAPAQEEGTKETEKPAPAKKASPRRHTGGDSK